jgi:hypothetical protein
VADEMTIDELRTLVRNILANTTRRLVQTANFEPCAYIIRADRAIASLPFDGAILESGSAKRVLFAALADTVRKCGGFGLIVVTDAWTLFHSEEQNRRIFEDAEYRAGLEAVTREQGVPEAARLGYGTLAEIIACTAQTRLWGLIGRQQYRRAGADWRHIVLEGDPVFIDTASGGKLSGRLIQLYEEEEGHA